MSADQPQESRASPGPAPGDGARSETEAALDAEREKNLRLLADFENHRRRVARESQAARDEGRRAALLAFLPVFDTLERALEMGSTDGKFYDGVAATGRLFLEALNAAGAEAVPALGQPFDPRVHEVVEVAADGNAEDGTVVREVRRGFRMGGELLRPSQVAVARSPEAAEPWR